MKPTKLALAEHATVPYYHVPDMGVSFGDTLKPEYWTHVAPSLRMGHRIEMLAADGSWWAMLIVRAAGRTEAVVQELQHVELGEAIAPDVEGSDYEVIWRGPARKFSVVRKADKEIVREDFPVKEDAIRWMNNHIKNLAA